MIPSPASSTVTEPSIPRESGDDPKTFDAALPVDQYSPRERG